MQPLNPVPEDQSLKTNLLVIILKDTPANPVSTGAHWPDSSHLERHGAGEIPYLERVNVACQISWPFGGACRSNRNRQPERQCARNHTSFRDRYGEP